jgi:putative DNA primase/helicase
MDSKTFNETARRYIKEGFNVIPLYGYNAEEVEESHRGKRPLVQWEKFKTEKATDADITAWCKLRPEINLGIVCGTTSGITVIDADTEEAVKYLEELGVTDTLKVKTSHGYHFYYNYCPNVLLTNAVRALPGIDFRTQGGQVVAPPSTHRSGFQYEWTNWGTPIANFPAKILDILAAKQEEQGTANAKPKGIAGKDISTMGEGSGRDSLLISVAGSLRKLGFTSDMIEANLTEINNKFAESLPETDLMRIVKSACGYAAEEQKHRLTDVGVAERFKDKHGETLCFNSSSGDWMLYTGAHWSSLETDKRTYMCPEVTDKLVALVRSIPDEVKEDSEYRDAYEKFARGCEVAGKIKALIGLCADKMKKSNKIFDQHKNYLNCKNKTLDLDTHKVLEPKPAMYLTKRMNVNLDPSADCPIWKAFLQRIFNNNADLINYMQRAVGYSITGSTKEQVFFTLYGSGANGKSVFLDTLQHIFGDYSQQASFSTFLAKNGDGGVRNDVACMQGARFICAAESGVFKTIDDALIKDITGGKNVRARFLHKEFFEYEPQMKIWLATNHKPNIYDDSNGMWRRVQLIPFTITIPKEEQDRNLYWKLLDEASGILNWCLEGLKVWQRDGLGTCAAVETATENYQETMDVLGKFSRETLKRGADMKIKSSELYRHFVEWCDAEGEKRWSNKLFSMKWEDKGYVKAKLPDGMYWLGIDWNREFV